MPVSQMDYRLVPTCTNCACVFWRIPNPVNRSVHETRFSP